MQQKNCLQGTQSVRTKAGNATVRITPAASCTDLDSDPYDYGYELEPMKYYHIVVIGADQHLRAHLYDYVIDKPKHGGAHVRY